MAGNLDIALLVDIEGTKIVAHCLAKFNRLPDNTFQVFCEQLQVDSAKGDYFIKQCEDWSVSYAPVSQVAFATDEGKYRSFRRKYGYEVHKVGMIKYLKIPSEAEGVESGLADTGVADEVA